MMPILKELAQNNHESALEILMRLRRTTPISIVDVLAWVSAVGVFAVTLISALGVI